MLVFPLSSNLSCHLVQPDNETLGADDTPEKVTTLAVEHVLHSQISSSKLELAMEIGKFIDSLEEQLELLPTNELCYVG